LVADKTLFLHVGAPKCASSTLQEAFLSNRDSLRALNINYPLPTKSLEKLQGNASDFALAALNLGFENAKTLSILNRLLEGEEHVLLSSEFLYAFAMGQAVTELEKRARAKGFKIHVILVLRRQDLWLESDYKQHIKGGTLWHGSVQDLLDTRLAKRTLNYDFILDRWAEWSDDLSVFVLNKSTPSDEIVKNTFSSLGVPLEDLPQKTWLTKANVSPSNHLMEAANLIKRELAGQGHDHVYVEQVLKQFFAEKKGTDAVAPIPSLLSAEQRNFILNRFADGNKRVAQKYFDRDALFEPVVEENLTDPKVYFEASEKLAQSFLRKKQRSAQLEKGFSRPFKKIASFLLRRN